MEYMTELQAKLDRAQAEIKKGVGRLVKQRALIAHLRGGSKDVAQSQELLATLEDIQRLHVQDRGRLRSELDWTLAGKNARP
jgi:hypothetical protein